jgi:hypothetical protein
VPSLQFISILRVIINPTNNEEIICMIN